MDPNLVGAASALAGAVIASSTGLLTARLTMRTSREEPAVDAAERARDRQLAMESELRDKRIAAHTLLLSALREDASHSFSAQGERDSARAHTDEVTAVMLLSSREVGDLADAAAELTWKLCWSATALHGEVTATQREEFDLTGEVDPDSPEQMAAISKYTQMRAETHTAILEYRPAAQAEILGVAAVSSNRHELSRAM